MVICYETLKYIVEGGKKKGSGSLKEYVKKWKDTLLSVLNVLNKISLVIDRNIPNNAL